MEQQKVDRPTVSRSQATLAKEVAHYLTAHMEERCTLEQAAKRFHVSASSI